MPNTSSVAAPELPASSKLQVRPLTGHFGVEVRNVDLRTIADDELEFLKARFRQDVVMVIRGQELTPEDQLQFTRRWGEVYITPYVKKLDGYPEILAVRNRGKSETVTEQWHHDASFLPEPPGVGILAAQVLPAAGGDTMFADQRAAYSALSQGMRDMIGRLKAWHQDKALYKLSGLASSDLEPMLHPVVITHESGRPALYLSATFVDRFDGMTPNESEPLLRQLVSHGADPEFVYRHQWQMGDVVLWDQRATLHYAVHDYGDAERVLYRTTVAGPRPI